MTRAALAAIPLAIYSFIPSSSPVPKEWAVSKFVRVAPATCTQRGQFRDPRRTHRHAGIDCVGERGSPIVAAFGGVVLPAPGRDRGYGPHVLVIAGDGDGLCYRYAHLDSVSVEIGQRVSTGDQIGTMGAVGHRGMPHLHFELIPCQEYVRKPYGVHSLDPNVVLNGGRGVAMTVAERIQDSKVLLAMASIDTDSIIEPSRVRRHRAGRHHYHRRHHRRRII